ncbi:hypothetical protein B566_EDAN013631 [Ephemera danica]|nr:hypothetical protein B566_EDAN013631 [Ephemera danica]
MEVESVVNGHHGNGLSHEDKPVVMNGDVDFGSTNGAASMIIMNSSNPVDQRIKKRATRRLMRQNSKEATSPNGASAVVQATRSFKNSRRPRNGYGRGLPKKGRRILVLFNFF